MGLPTNTPPPSGMKAVGMSMVGRRRLAGITDQANPSNIFQFQWYQNDAATIVNAHGFLVPLSGSVSHANDIKYLKDSRGNTVTVLATDERVTIQVVATPDGAPGQYAMRDVLESATFPQPNGWVTITNAPLLSLGNFLDVFNTGNWLYNGDGSLEMASDNEWGMRFSLTRFANIVFGAAMIV